jgi:hypothetical protein
VLARPETDVFGTMKIGGSLYAFSGSWRSRGQWVLLVAVSKISNYQLIATGMIEKPHQLLRRLRYGSMPSSIHCLNFAI